MSDTTISVAAPATSTAAVTAGTGRRAPAEGTPGFTALLAAALGGDASTGPASALILSGELLADTEGEDAPVDPAAPAADESADDAVAALLAAAVAGTAATAPSRPTEAPARGDGAEPAAGRPADLAAGGLPPTVELEAVEGASAQSPGDDAAVVAPTAGATVAPMGASASNAPASKVPVGDAATAAALGVDAESVAAVTNGAEPAAAAVDPAASRPDAAATPVAGSATAPVAASAEAAPAPAPAETGTAHARMVARVMDALDVLENAPPPRRMTVELPDADGLRLHVALRGSEVHVSILGGGSASDHSGWSRDLTTALAARGFGLGGFDSGSGREGQRQPREPLPQPEGAPAPARRARPATTDQGLRL